MNDRYSRQERFFGIGKDGQEKIRRSRVAIIGLGALGTVIAEELTRAGIGFLRLIDRDFVELHNLQRQMLYDEEDARMHRLKVEACAQHLHSINSEVLVEAFPEDFNYGNAESFLQDVDLILDGTDNLETRYLINEVCVKLRKPWIYGGAVEAQGMTMSFLPGGACFSCVTGTVEPFMNQSTQKTCSTAGVLSPATAIVASLEVREALKILVSADTLEEGLITFDLWKNSFHHFQPEKKTDCPVCQKQKFHYLGRVSGMRASRLCGEDSIQILPEKRCHISFEDLENKLSDMGSVRRNKYYLTFESSDASFQVFYDGRAIILHVTSEAKAKAIYSEYIGL